MQKIISKLGTKIIKVSMNKQLTKQNFQMEVTSGYVMKLIKQTIENIRLAMREKNMGENQNKTHASSNTFKAATTGFVSRINK